MFVYKFDMDKSASNSDFNFLCKLTMLPSDIHLSAIHKRNW